MEVKLFNQDGTEGGKLSLNGIVQSTGMPVVLAIFVKWESKEVRLKEVRATFTVGVLFKVTDEEFEEMRTGDGSLEEKIGTVFKPEVEYDIRSVLNLEEIE